MKRFGFWVLALLAAHISLAQSAADWANGQINISTLRTEAINEGPILLDAIGPNYAVSTSGTVGVALLKAGGKPIPLVARGGGMKDQGPVPITSLALSQDGKLLAGGSTGGELFVWDLASRRQVFAANMTSVTRVYPGPLVYTLSFARDGRTLWAGYDDGKIRSWSLNTGKLLEELRLDGAPVVISPRNGYVLIARSDGLTLWDLANRKATVSLSKISPVRAAAFSLDETRLAVALNSFETSEPNVLLLEPSSGKLIGRYAAGLMTFSVAVSPNRQIIATGGMADSGDVSITLWDVSTGKSVRQLKLVAPPGRLTFDKTGRSLAMASDEGVTVWSLK